jgi:hypothetical protein
MPDAALRPATRFPAQGGPVRLPGARPFDILSRCRQAAATPDKTEEVTLTAITA